MSMFFSWRNSIVLALLLIMLSYLFMQTNSLDTRVHKQISAQIRNFQRLNVEINRDLLLIRSGLLLHYDPLHKSFMGLQKLLNRLRNHKLESSEHQKNFNQQVQKLEQLTEQKEQLVIEFVSNSAVLRNSTLYFATLQVAIFNSPLLNHSIMQDLTRVAVYISQRNHNNNTNAALDARNALERLQQNTDLTEDSANMLSALRVHGEICLNRIVVVNQLLSDILGLPVEDALDNAHASYMIYNQYSREQGEFYKTILYIISLLMLSYIAWMVFSSVQASRKLSKTVEALRDSENRFQALLDNATFAIYMKNTNGEYTLANRPFKMLTEKQFDGIENKTDFDLFSNDIAKSLHDHDQSALDSRKPMESEEILVDSLGQQHTYMTVRFPLLHGDGTPYAVCGFLTDITLRKQTELELSQYREHLEDLVQKRTTELTSVNRELEAFSYSVSHDLRAPLRAIDGFSLALAEDYEDLLDNTGKHYIERIRKGCQRMQMLIDDLIKLSRVSRSEINPTPVDLTLVAKDVIKSLKEHEPERNVSVHIQDNVSANGDGTLLRVLLENLLNNAWKYTKREDAAEIYFGTNTKNGETVYFVQDNGVGIDMKYSDKIFQPFARLHKPEEFDGTGIGLATVLRVIRRHGGRIWVESNENYGTCFYFTLKV